MCCLLALFSLITPRVILLILWLFTDYLSRAYHSWIWPLLGFLFLPLTTIAYAWAINVNGSVSGLYLVVVIIAVLLDLGFLGGGHRARRRKR